VRTPGSHSPSGPSPPTSVAFVYAVLTCENIPLGPASATRSSRRSRPPQHAIVSSADPLITDIWRTGSGQSNRFGEPLAVADGDGMRRHPARTANTKAPAAAASARVPAWPPPIDSYGGEPTRALPSSPPGSPCLARRAAVIRNRGEHDLEGQATAAPGARRPVIAQDPLSPLAGDDQRVPAGSVGHAGEPHAQGPKARPWILPIRHGHLSR
jgi:hypothetical protein